MALQALSLFPPVCRCASGCPAVCLAGRHYGTFTRQHCSALPTVGNLGLLFVCNCHPQHPAGSACPPGRLNARIHSCRCLLGRHLCYRSHFSFHAYHFYITLIDCQAGLLLPRVCRAERFLASKRCLSVHRPQQQPKGATCSACLQCLCSSVMASHSQSTSTRSPPELPSSAMA